jgi:Ca-activated chloride channel family protein
MPDLSFLSANRLWLLLVPLALVAVYVAMQLRRRRYAVRFTNVALLDQVAPDRPGWRRHLPAAVLALGVIAAVLAFARPAVAEQDQEQSGVVILAIDTSLSMQATDVAPSRVQAAKDAAKAFLETVPDGVRIGIVGFDGQARQLLAPTTNTAAIARTIDRLQLGEGTAIGDAVATSLDSIHDTFAKDGSSGSTTTAPPSTAATEGQPAPATIVLLSDGETTTGQPNEQAAREAAAQGIAVQTIAFGTDRGTVETPDGQQVPVPVNRAALQELARQTDGRYFPAATGEQLRQVYEELGRSTVTGDPIEKDVSEWFVGSAIVLLVMAAAGSLLWFSRLP